MTWWCSATGEAWTWAWRAYPGVWLFVALLLIWYWWSVLRPGHRRPLEPPNRRAVEPSGRQTAWFLTGLLCIWLALDWPIGALGAGYLASVHTVSYILLAIVAPPCLILGIPRATVLQALDRPTPGTLLRLAARPFGLLLFNAILFLTHFPSIVDGLLGSQVGALAVDIGWLAGGLALWWPVMGPAPELVRLSRPLKMAYLFVATLPPIIPSAFLTFAEYPLYSTYELAPRVFTIMTAQQDQQVAGLVMKLIGDLPLWFAFGVVFFRWAREENPTPGPVHPDAVRVGGRE
jgi:putative membrane protein